MQYNTKVGDSLNVARDRPTRTFPQWTFSGFVSIGQPVYAANVPPMKRPYFKQCCIVAPLL